VRFRIEQRFNGPLADVETALLDPGLLERMAELPKLGAPVLLDDQRDQRQVRRRVRYQFTGELNPAVRRAVDPARLTWVEESTTDLGTHRTSWQIVPDHYGSMIRGVGTFQLEASGADTTRRVTEADIRVTMPLVGGRVERAIVSGLEEHAEGEQALVDTWLAERRR
jgi:hypothetical protein